MGVNNRARRAAKKRKRSPGRPVGTGVSGFRGAAAQNHPPGEPPTDRQLAELLVADAVDMSGGDEGTAGRLADRMLAGNAQVPPTVIGAAMERLLRRLTHVVVQAGWGPRDLTELVRRRLTLEHQPVLAAALHHEMSRHSVERVAPQWRAELAAIGATRHPPLHGHPGLTLALVLAAVLVATPRIPRLMPPPGGADPLDTVRWEPGGQGAKVLARVRALLAKAESTEFAEEAEALSTKAQELISRYSLDQLMGAAETAGQDPTTIIARRFWLDAPYVSAKASLIAEVALANRCSTVSAEKLGFTTVAGTSGDLDAVELLTTSLMVQADAAMLAAGRRTDRHGTSRTASYRRSFLLAYAHRIGERLSDADQAVSTAVADVDGGGVLVPTLRAHGERVDAALAEMFPDVVYKRRTVGNWQGWAEGGPRAGPRAGRPRTRRGSTGTGRSVADVANGRPPPSHGQVPARMPMPY